MAHGKTLFFRTLLFLSFSFHLTSAVTHSLQYFYTAVTPGINFPEYTDVGQLDRQQFVYYDSNIRRYIPKTEWIEKNVGDDYWESQTQTQQAQEETFKFNIVTAMQRFNHTKGVHTLQRMYGCELDDDGTVRGYDELGYDGEDFVSLDLTTQTWIAPKSQAVITKNKWDSTRLASYDTNYLENECVVWLKRYMHYGRERKVVPEVSVFQEEVTSPEVVCHATGFFPKAVMITWQKNGEDVHEDVELRETLPNQDGNFQKRSVLKVPAEELDKYTCVVQHSSSEKDIVLKVSDRRILKGGGSIAIIVGVIVALVALIAVGVGIVIWKKNSGFKPVPAKPSSEGDSSSNNS